jgi:hypothetical protein
MFLAPIIRASSADLRALLCSTNRSVGNAATCYGEDGCSNLHRAGTALMGGTGT